MKEFTFLVLFSIVTIFIFRMLPFFFKNNKYLNDKDSFIYKSINYSAQAMIGIIVYNSAFSSKNVLQLLEQVNIMDFIKIVFLVMAFVITVKTKKIIPGFLFFLSLYTLIIYAVN